MSGPDPGEGEILEALVRRDLGARIVGREVLAPGLGTRRFLRLTLVADTAEKRRVGEKTPASVIARIEPREAPESAPFGVVPEPGLEPLRSFLEEHAIPVPARYGGDLERGIELLEDAGPVSLENAAAQVSQPERIALYREACALVPRLQRLSADPERIPAFGRRLDRALIESKAHRWIHWALPSLLARDASPAEAETVKRAFELIGDACESAPARLAHRDYKAANIHLRPGAEAGARLILIDLQGAFLAPPEYDLVCLLRDSHVALAENEVDSHRDATRQELPDAPSEEDFDRRFTLLTLSRVAKDCAHYIHAATDRNDRRYLPLLPTGLANLERAAEHAAGWDPRLARLRDLLAALPSGPAALEAVAGEDDRCGP